MNRWVKFWKEIDRARIVPRMSLLFYTYQMWQVQQWFIELKDPSAAQSAFTSVVWGAFPLLLNFYMQQGIDLNKLAKDTPP
jgi:hypothetical protein